MKFEPRNPAYIDLIKSSFAKQRVMRLIGAELDRIEPGLVTITLPYREVLSQQDGYLHAGIITTIMDSACGYAAYSLMPTGSEVLSVEFKVNLLRPARAESFVAEGEVLKPGKMLTVVRGNTYGFSGDKQELVATMQGTMIRVER